MVFSFKSSTFFAYRIQMCNNSVGWPFDLWERNVSILLCRTVSHIPVLTHAFLCQKIIFSSNNPNFRRKRTIPKINRILQMNLTSSKNLPSGWKLSATSYHHTLHSQQCSSQNLLLKLILACSVFKPFSATPMEVRQPGKPSFFLGFIPYHPLQQLS